MNYLGQPLPVAQKVPTWLSDALERRDLYASTTYRMMDARTRVYLYGRVEEALEEVDRALADWPLSTFGTHEFLGIILRVDFNLYRNNAAAAYENAQYLDRRFRRSVMQRSQICRLATHLSVGNAALAMARATPKSGRRPYVVDVRRRVQKLFAEHHPWAEAVGSYFQATLLGLKGHKEEAAREMRLAAIRLRDQNTIFYAIGAEKRLAELAGQTDSGASDEDLRSRGIGDPAGLIRLTTPGWDG
jgi:hypothetical protein